MQCGIKINSKKTKTMVIERKIKKVNMQIQNEAVEQKYLGFTISSNMSCCQEVKRRIAISVFGISPVLHRTGGHQ